MNEQWQQLITPFLGFLAMTLGILRMAMTHQKSFVERMLAIFEDRLSDQSRALSTFRDSVENLSTRVQENSRQLQYLTEWLQVSSPPGDDS